ncbi:MAG: hypothetical protein Q8O67_16730 [Deltaproteobacteria bacterium]|nr:hypothetical protein [Deltaproteobacteria bacterium]
MLAWILTGFAALGALIVLLGSALLGSMFLGSGSDSDRVAGVAVVCVGVLWACVVGVGAWLAHGSAGHQSAGLVVLGVHVVVDVGLAGLLLVAVEAAARP